MWLSMFSVWGGLLTLVASQSCPDPSENSASWVRLKPLGQCKDGESTCPYRITLPPLTVQLPKHFRELEKMAEELQRLTQMVNQLKADCCECKDRQGKDWNIRTDNEGEDEEKIQAPRGTLNTRERQQDMVTRESTVQATTSKSGVEDIMIISSDAKDINPTALGKQRNTNQERNINPRTTKPRPESNGGQKGSNPVRKNLISGSKVDEVPSLTSPKKNTPQDKLTESSFLGDPDNEPPTHHEKHKDNPIKVGHEVNPSETLTAKGKVKSVPEYHVVTMDTEDDDDVETKQLQTTKGDKVQGERGLVTGTDAQNNRELETNMKQLTRKTQSKEDNKEFTDAGVKESRSNIFDDSVSVSVIQQPTLKNTEKNNHGANSTKPLKPGVYSGGDAKVNSRPVNIDDTTRRQKKVMSPITGRANASDNVSQMDQQTVGIKSKNTFTPDTDATMDTGTESKFTTAKKVSELKHSRPPNSGRANSTADGDLINRSTLNSNVQTPKKPGKDAESNTGMDADRVSGLQNSGLPISGINDGKADVSPTNSEIPSINYHFKADTDSKINDGIDLKPVNVIETVSEIKNSRSPISDSVNVTADVDPINAKRKSSNSQTILKSSKDAESHIRMNSNPVSVQNNSRSPVSGMTDGMVGESLTNPQIGHKKTHVKSSTESGSEARVGKSNPVNNVETVSGRGTSRSPISKERLKNSRPPTTGRANSTAVGDLINRSTLKSNVQTPPKPGKDAESNTGMDADRVSGLQNSGLPISGINDDKADVSPTNSEIPSINYHFKAGTDSEIDAGIDLKPVNVIETVSEIKNSRSPISDSVNVTADVDPIHAKRKSSNSQTILKSTKDAESHIRMNSNSVNALNNSRSPVSGMTDGMVGETNPQVGHRKTHVKTSTESGSEARVGKSNPVNNVETVSGRGTSRSPISKERLKNSRPPTTGRANSTAVGDLINRSTLKSNVQTPPKPGKDAESNTGMDADRVSGLQNSGLPISGINDDKADVSPTNSQIPSINYHFKAGTDSEIDAGIDLKPVNIIETISETKNSRSPISDNANVTADVDLISAKRKSSNPQTTLKSSKDAESHIRMNSNPVNALNNSRSPVSGMTDGMVGETNPQIGHRKTHVKTSTESGSDPRVGKSNPINNVETVSGRGTSRSPISKEGLKNSRLSIPDRANSTAEIDRKHPKSLNPQMPSTHDTDVHSKSGMDQNQFNASETVSHLQTSKSPKSEITDTFAVNQTYPRTLDDTFTKAFKPVTDKERNAKMDLKPLNKVETNNNPIEMPRLSIIDKADATVNIKQINTQTTYSNSENATVISTSGNKVETVGGLEKPRLPISVSERKPGIYPNRTDIKRKDASKPPSSDSRPDISGTNLNGNNGPPRRQFLPRTKLNMTQPRNGWSSKPTSTDTERKTAPTNNKTALRSDAMTSGRRLPTGLLPKRQEKQREITHQPERISPTGISISKDYIQRKPNILQRIPINESKPFGSGGSKNTSGVIDYTISSGTTHSDSKTASSPNNKFNSTAYDISQSVSPTLATQDNVDRADTKGTKTSPTVNVLRTLMNHHIESTSHGIGNKPKVKKTNVSSRDDLVLDTVGKTGRDTQPRVVEETKGIERRPGQTSFKTTSDDSNQQKHNKPLSAGDIQNLGLNVVESSGRHELNVPTTVATPFTVKPQIKDNHSKGSRFTPPIKATPHFMDQDPVEQVKTTSGMKVSNKHIHPRLENPSQEMEPKRSHSDTGNKGFHSASSGQGSRVGQVTDFQPNSLDPIQNRTPNSIPIVMDMVKVSTGSKVSTISTESTNKNRAKDSIPVAMDKIEASTEANQITQSLDNDEHHENNKSSLGSTDTVEGNNGGHSIDKNNGNYYPVSVNRRTSATLHKTAAGHPNNGGNKKPLTVNNMDDRQGLEKQPSSNCRGQCNPGPASQSILHSHETSNNNRDKPPQDCSDFMRRNLRSGIYNITPARSGNRTFPVFCNMKSSGGGWTLIQRRFDGSISFNRTWNDYKEGFGKLMGEFWLGNDKIHWLTTTKTMVLRIELEDLDGNKEYAQYDHFHVANESQYYKLTIEGYSGTAGDAMQYSKHFDHNQKNFTTPDRDNDQYTSGNCGAYYGSGWWFDACLSANLNGKYYETRYRGVRNGIFWGTWHNISIESYPTHDRQSFKTVRMMIRPRTEFLMD